jgi:hypothetical protein
MDWTATARDVASACGLPWVLLPVPGALAVWISRRPPEILRETVARLGTLAVITTLPVAALAVALPHGDALLGPDNALALNLLIYRLHDWVEHRWWLGPAFVVPMLVGTGFLSYVTCQPGVIKAAGRVTGVVGRISLALYVLSLFSLVAPGPVALNIDAATEATRARLQVQLNLQRDAETEYLATNTLHVLLGEPSNAAQQGLADVARDVMTLAQRLGCANDTTQPKCRSSLPPAVARAFAQALNKETGTPAAGATTASPAPADAGAATPARPETLPERAAALAKATTTTERLHERSEALAETLDATAGAMADALPFGQLAKAVLGELFGVIGRAGAAMLSPGAEPAAQPDDPAFRRTAQLLSRAVAAAAAILHRAVAARGPFVLLRSADATQAELDQAERAAAQPESTVSDLLTPELRAALADRDRTMAAAADRAGADFLRYILDRDRGGRIEEGAR